MNAYLTQQLKEGRLAKGLKQSDVTELTGIKNTTLSNYENGNTEPDMDTFLQLCELYDLDYAEILGEAYGYHVSGNNFEIRKSEIDHIKKYRNLDDYGKESIRMMLERESERAKALKAHAEQLAAKDTRIAELEAAAQSSAAKLLDIQCLEDDKSYLEPLAAHHRTDINEEAITEEMKQHDMDIMNDPDF